jgi:hypothetical protein
VSKSADHQLEEQSEEEKMAAAIMQYLDEHPHAQDTLEGIASFWIVRHQVREDVKAVMRALRRLTASGMLEEVRRGRYTHYRRKH